MMTITWDIDEARAVIRAQMAEANRLDEVIDDLSADLSAAERAREAAEAECERLRAWAVAAYNARQPITDAALRMVLNVEADSDMTAGQRREGDDTMDDILTPTEKMARALKNASARAEAAEATLASCNRARQAAEAEIEAVHRYLDECFVNDPDEGQAVPLIDRVVLLVSRIARDGGEAKRLREELAALSHTNAVMAGDYGECQQALDAMRDQVAALARQSASHDFLSDAKDEIWELFVAVRDDFDGSEYQQGKKDGLRSALALLGTPEMIAFNREGGMANAANTSQDAR